MKRTFIFVTSCVMAIEVSNTTEKPIAVDGDGIADDYIILCDTDNWKIYVERNADLVDVIKMMDGKLHINIQTAIDMVADGGCFGYLAEIYSAILWQ